MRLGRLSAAAAAMLGLLTVVVACDVASARARPAQYRVGIAARSINPDPNGTWHGQPVYLGGYGFGGPPIGNRHATGILGVGIHVRALAVSDGRHAFAIADEETQGWFVATK